MPTERRYTLGLGFVPGSRFGAAESFSDGRDGPAIRTPGPDRDETHYAEGEATCPNPAAQSMPVERLSAPQLVSLLQVPERYDSESDPEA